MAIQKIAIVSLPVTDQQRAKRFYVDKLGFKVTAEAADAMGPGKSWITVSPDDGNGTNLTLVNWFDTMKGGSLRGLVILSDDLDGDCARFKLSGVDIDAIKEAPWGRFATARDSEGNGLVFQASRD